MIKYSRKIILLQGLPASGKTRFANKICKRFKRYSKIERDELREFFFKKRRFLSKRQERFISFIQVYILRYFLYKKCTPIIADNNLDPKIIDWWKVLSIKYNFKIKRIFLNTDYKECVLRDSQRNNATGWIEIIKRYIKYIKS